MNAQSPRAVRALTLLLAVLLVGGRLAHAAGSAGKVGPALAMELRPDKSASWARVCSVRHGLCVAAPPGTLPALYLAALTAADRAWEALTEVLEGPAPDGALGDPWDIYLVDGVEGGARAVTDERDPQSRFDRESSFALVDRSSPLGCPLDLALARAVAQGSLLRAAPATDAGSLRAQSEALARLATPCSSAGEDDAEFQGAPWRCVVDPARPSFDRGAALFMGWVDETLGAEPGGVLVGAWALAPTRTAPGAAHWPAAPTTFDVLRVSFRSALEPEAPPEAAPEVGLDDALVRFAVARAAMTPRPSLAWNIPWPLQARRLAPPEPIAPTGASYVKVDCAGAPAGARLRIEAQWEDYARIRWVVLKRDAQGKTLAKLLVTSTDHGTAASMNVEQLDGVDHLLIIAENLGSTDHPFDLDQGEWEPHGWLLTLEGQTVLGP